jgi:hypothetical protein
MSMAWSKKLARRMVKAMRPRLALPGRTLLPVSYRAVHRSIVRNATRRDRRIARTCHRLLQRIGHPILGYKVCLITEAQFLERHDPPNQEPGLAASEGRPPILDQVLHYLRAQLVHRLVGIKDATKRLVALVALVTRRPRSALAPPSHLPVAGVFEGLSYRMISKSPTEGLVGSAANGNQAQHYQATTRQARELQKSLRSIRSRTQGSMDTGIGAADNEDKVGIIISCFHPERYLNGFLSNLKELENPQRLIPVIVNAGMSEEAERKIRTALDTDHFHQSHFITALGSGIYEAWNIAIEAAGESVLYLTNFNVDDRRHPLCLDVQADALKTFPNRQLVVTDYLYFFTPKESIVDLYEENRANGTQIPVINKRTIVYRNLPHSSPMWRQSLHRPEDCGMFNKSYRSAGDADFWYRVSQRHENPAEVVSIPLSLYYNNPSGLSTRPATAGEWEHKICSDPHYLKLMDAIDIALPESFVAAHCRRKDAEHLQLFAALSAIKQP